MKKYLFLTLFLFFILISLAYPQEIKNATYKIHDWELNPKKTFKVYLKSQEFSIINFRDNDRYKNLILKRFLNLNPELIERTTIYRSKEMPQRDFLFINNKLYSIMEIQLNIDLLKFKKLYIKLQKIYGTPSLKKERKFTYYSYKTKKTDVLLITRPNNDNYDLKIYFYNHFWVKSLIFE